MVVEVAVVWLLLLSLVAIRVFSASLCSGGRSDLGWKKGVDKDVITTINIASDTITTNSDIKAVFFLFKITIVHTPPFQGN
jgi:hypothetical protein